MPPPLPIQVYRDEIRAILTAEPDMAKVDRAYKEVHRNIEDITTGMGKVSKDVAIDFFKPLKNELYKLEDEMRARESAGTRTKKVIGDVGKVAGAAGNVVSGIGGSEVTELAATFLGPMGGAIAGAVTKVVAAPFKLMADMAMNAAERLKSYSSILGITNVGLTNSIQTLRMIPVIGDSLAKIKEAERATLEANVGFVKDLVPALVDQLQQAGQELRAAKGLGKMGETRDIIRANRTAADIELAASQMGEESRRKYEELLEAAERKSPEDLLKLSKEGKERDLAVLMHEIEAHPKGMSREQEAKTRGEARDILGKELPSARGLAARPAQFSSFLEYEKQLQQRAFSQGDIPSKQLSELEKAVEALGAIRDALNKDPTADVRKAMDAAVERATNAAAGGLGPVQMAALMAAIRAAGGR